MKFLRPLYNSEQYAFPRVRAGAPETGDAEKPEGPWQPMASAFLSVAWEAAFILSTGRFCLYSKDVTENWGKCSGISQRVATLFPDPYPKSMLSYNYPSPLQSASLSVFIAK